MTLFEARHRSTGRAGRRCAGSSSRYDGTGFRGFAVQPDQRTVAGVLGKALGQVLRTEVDLACAGRTDAGVHAWGQVVSFEAPPGLDVDRLQASAQRDARARDRGARRPSSSRPGSTPAAPRRARRVPLHDREPAGRRTRSSTRYAWHVPRAARPARRCASPPTRSSASTTSRRSAGRDPEGKTTASGGSSTRRGTTSATACCATTCAPRRSAGRWCGRSSARSSTSASASAGPATCSRSCARGDRAAAGEPSRRRTASASGTSATTDALTPVAHWRAGLDGVVDRRRRWSPSSAIADVAR